MLPWLVQAVPSAWKLIPHLSCLPSLSYPPWWKPASSRSCFLNSPWHNKMYWNILSNHLRVENKTLRKCPSYSRRLLCLRHGAQGVLLLKRVNVRGMRGFGEKKKRREREYERRGRGLERMESGEWLGPLHGASSVWQPNLQYSCLDK